MPHFVARPQRLSGAAPNGDTSGRNQPCLPKLLRDPGSNQISHRKVCSCCCNLQFFMRLRIEVDVQALRLHGVIVGLRLHHCSSVNELLFSRDPGDGICIHGDCPRCCDGRDRCRRRWSSGRNLEFTHLSYSIVQAGVYRSKNSWTSSWISAFACEFASSTTPLPLKRASR